jgi:hypothetical protein
LHADALIVLLGTERRLTNKLAEIIAECGQPENATEMNALEFSLQKLRNRRDAVMNALAQARHRMQSV